MKTGQDEEATEEFRNALASIGARHLRAEVHVEEIPAPARVAPYAAAFLAEVGDNLASGRWVVLYDPAGQDAWHGQFRVVTLTRAKLEPELAADEFLPAVAWTWLQDALATSAARAELLGGTITRVSSESFGALADRPGEIELEVRASWTPSNSDLGAHFAAWTSLLCTAAGLPPLPHGVTSLRARRNAVHI